MKPDIYSSAIPPSKPRIWTFFSLIIIPGIIHENHRMNSKYTQLQKNINHGTKTVIQKNDNYQYKYKSGGSKWELGKRAPLYFYHVNQEIWIIKHLSFSELNSTESAEFVRKPFFFIFKITKNNILQNLENMEKII